MQQKLSRLTRELQKEKCPQRVHDEVQRKISARATSPGGWRLILRVGAVAFVLLMCGVEIRRWQAERKARQQAELAELALRDRVQIQAEDALGLIGSVLADASTHSGKVIYDRAVPPLRNSLRTANNKIIHDIPL